MIPFGIMDATIYTCITATIVASLFAIPGLYLSYRATSPDDDKDQARVRRRKKSQQKHAPAWLAPEARLVRKQAKRLMTQVQAMEERQGCTDAELQSIKDDIESILQELKLMQ